MAERPQKFPKPRTKIFMHTNWEIFMQKDSSHVKESYMKFLDFAPKGNRVTDRNQYIPPYLFISFDCCQFNLPILLQLDKEKKIKTDCFEAFSIYTKTSLVYNNITIIYTIARFC